MTLKNVLHICNTVDTWSESLRYTYCRSTGWINAYMRIVQLLAGLAGRLSVLDFLFFYFPKRRYEVSSHQTGWGILTSSNSDLIQERNWWFQNFQSGLAEKNITCFILLFYLVFVVILRTHFHVTFNSIKILEDLKIVSVPLITKITKNSHSLTHKKLKTSFRTK